ncbi:hypothetical protein [Mucilaginibacter sp.]|uniref:hypothetical protein n=1 Tax=Mucilaginibacter sp. TaxID=1882438 RepID=UPI00285291F7|nr:hypothetical protein [Mucilaginibacter sp.]
MYHLLGASSTRCGGTMQRQAVRLCIRAQLTGNRLPEPNVKNFPAPRVSDCSGKPAEPVNDALEITR